MDVFQTICVVLHRDEGHLPQKHRVSVATGSHDIKGLSGYTYIFPSLGVILTVNAE
jgi:hypothetical protein